MSYTQQGSRKTARLGLVAILSLILVAVGLSSQSAVVSAYPPPLEAQTSVVGTADCSGEVTATVSWTSNYPADMVRIFVSGNDLVVIGEDQGTSGSINYTFEGENGVTYDLIGSVIFVVEGEALEELSFNTVTVPAECPPTLVTAVEPGYTPPTCDAPGTVTAATTEGVTYVVVDNGNGTSSVTANFNPGYNWSDPTLARTVTFGPYNTAQLSGEDCAPPPVDVCPNIPGDQSEVPEGYEVSELGCVPIFNPSVTVLASLDCQGNLNGTVTASAGSAAANEFYSNAVVLVTLSNGTELTDDFFNLPISETFSTSGLDLKSFQVTATADFAQEYLIDFEPVSDTSDVDVEEGCEEPPVTPPTNPPTTEPPVTTPPTNPPTTPGPTTVAPTPTVPNGDLPKTGESTDTAAGLATLGIAAGLLLLLISRRRRFGFGNS